MEKFKSVQEQKYEGTIARLENLIKDKEIEGPEFENIRNDLVSVFNTLKSEFKLGQNNSELIGRLENQLLGIDESKLQDSKFETFRTTLGKIQTIFNHELE
jgi:hypothetical protein